jgi:D-alanyl-D-alanine carboxypeptidase
MMEWRRKCWLLRCAVLTCMTTGALLFTSPALAALDSVSCSQLKRTGVIGAGAPVSCDRLAVVRFPYVDFNGGHHDDGELMVLAAVAPEVGQLFHQLYQRGFPLAHARLMTHYHGDDGASMQDNNTAAFNHRQITGGGPLSLHAYGLAIDINPLQNPFVQPGRQGIVHVSPPAATTYLNRLAARPGKPARPGMAESVTALFAQYGFTVWGGYWDAPIDYQHFQFSRELAERLVTLSLADARRLYLDRLGKLRRCLNAPPATAASGMTCALD